MYTERPTDEGKRLIPAKSFTTDPHNLSALLGPWQHSLESLSKQFSASGTVPHVVSAASSHTCSNIHAHA